jgi:hypothetical protein
MDEIRPYTDLTLAFTEGMQAHHTEEGESLRIRVVQAGELLVTSGWIVARDPHQLGWNGHVAYTTRVPVGRHPVLLSMPAYEPNSATYVACAKLCFSKQEVVRWEMAVRPGQKISTLGTGEFFGYGVDSGAGCFTDLDMVTWLFEQAGVRNLEQWRGLPGSMKDTPDERKKLVEAVSRYFKDVVTDPLFNACFASTASPKHVSMTLNETTGGNLVMFHTGWGDASYASYFGYAADGSLTCLVTDFEVLSDAQWNSSI